MLLLNPPDSLKRCFDLWLSASACVAPHAGLFFLACAADACLLPLEEGSCGRYTMRWYFNSRAQACRPFVYSGCEGNANRFLQLEECEEVCLLEAGGTAHTHTHTGDLTDLWCVKANCSSVVQVLVPRWHDDESFNERNCSLLLFILRNVSFFHFNYLFASVNQIHPEGAHPHHPPTHHPHSCSLHVLALF